MNPYGAKVPVNQKLVDSDDSEEGDHQNKSTNSKVQKQQAQTSQQTGNNQSKKKNNALQKEEQKVEKLVPAPK